MLTGGSALVTLIHIVAGLLALAAGAVALCAAKGSRLHKRSGAAFAAAMLVMASTGAVMSVLLEPNRVNVVAAAMTIYLVSSGLLALRRSVAERRAITAGFMLLALTIALRAFDLGFEALGDPRGRVDGVPGGPVFMFAVVGTMAAGLDARLLWAGRIAGAHRLARHLWRMTFAMWIATTSFFLGQADVFPEPVRKSGLLAIPVLIVTGLLLYWLARVLIKRGRAVLEPGHLGGAPAVSGLRPDCAPAGRCWSILARWRLRLSR